MGRSIPICIVGATLKLSFDGHRKEGQEEFSVQKSSEHSMKWSLRWIHCIEKLCLLILEFISFANLQSARKQSLVLIQWRCRSRMQTWMRCSRLKWWNWPRQPWTDSTLRRTWPTGSRKSWTDNTRHFGTSLSAATLAPTSLMRPSTLCTSTLMSLQCFVIRRGEDYLMGCWDGFTCWAEQFHWLATVMWQRKVQRKEYREYESVYQSYQLLWHCLNLNNLWSIFGNWLLQLWRLCKSNVPWST